MVDWTNQYLKAFKRLPERFRKPNNKNLYYVLYGGFDDLLLAFDEVVESRNLDKAYGKTLDYLGANVGQFRQGEDDELYRNLIKVRIIANLSIGDIPTINHVMSVLCKDVYLGLMEGWVDEDLLYHEPAAIRLSLFNGGGIPLDIIQRIKAAGIKVLIDQVYFSFLRIKTQYGINNYLQYLCGEHLCSEIPWNDKIGHRSDVNIGIKTGQYNGKNYYSWSGDFKRAGEINDFETVEELYVQNVDVDYDIVYVFDD